MVTEAPSNAMTTRNAPTDGLIQALITQLAAGQSESLYSLQTAAAALRRRITELDITAAQLPEKLTPTLLALLDELALTSIEHAAGAHAELQQALATETKRHATQLTSTVKRASAAVEQAIADAADKIGEERALTEGLLEEAVRRLTQRITDGTTDVHDELAAGWSKLDAATSAHTSAAQQLREAAEQLDGTSAAAVTSIWAAAEAAGTQFEAVGEQLKATAAQSIEALADQHTNAIAGIAAATETAGAQFGAIDEQLKVTVSQSIEALANLHAAVETDLAEARRDFATTVAESTAALDQLRVTFAADAASATAAITQVGENLIERLILVLDDRDLRDQRLEKKLNARVATLTEKAETSVRRLIGELEDEADLLRHRDDADRATAAQQLSDLLDRLLSLPRGKLKELKAEAAKNQKEDTP
jgi:hypothetical protein